MKTQPKTSPKTLLEKLEILENSEYLENLEIKNNPPPAPSSRAM